MRRQTVLPVVYSSTDNSGIAREIERSFDPQIEVGELVINAVADNEKLFIRNSFKT